MKKFGVALYRQGLSVDEQEPIDLTRDELLSLRAFDLVFFDEIAPGHFFMRSAYEKAVPRFLKQYRSGRAK